MNKNLRVRINFKSRKSGKKKIKELKNHGERKREKNDQFFKNRINWSQTLYNL